MADPCSKVFSTACYTAVSGMMDVTGDGVYVAYNNTNMPHPPGWPAEGHFRVFNCQDAQCGIAIDGTGNAPGTCPPNGRGGLDVTGQCRWKH